MIQIDPEFHAYIPALTGEERAQLEQNLLEEGCRDPLVVWGDILIDGHNRFEICSRLGIPFTTVEKDFPDREAALDWMDAHQLGRRNLSPDARRLLLGRRYNRVKRAQGGTGANQHGEQSGQSDHSAPEKTAAKLAKEHGVSERTVRRAGEFAAEVEAKPELKAAIEAGTPVSRVRREIDPEPEPASEPECADPVEAKVRREIRRLTPEAMVDEIMGLRADVADAKIKIGKLKAEKSDLEVKLAEATQGDLGRALGNAQRRADAATGRMNEYMATVKRLERRLKIAEARVKELEETPIDMGAP